MNQLIYRNNHKFKIKCKGCLMTIKDTHLCKCKICRRKYHIDCAQEWWFDQIDIGCHLCMAYKEPTSILMSIKVSDLENIDSSKVINLTGDSNISAGKMYSVRKNGSIESNAEHTKGVREDNEK